MDLSRVEFKWTSEEICKNPLDYISRVIDIGCQFNLPRLKRYLPRHVVSFGNSDHFSQRWPFSLPSDSPG